MNAEERQLADMLRRVAPEPPSPVTVEDVAFRLANQAAWSGPRRHREPRAQDGSGRRGAWGRRWAPALAAAAVIVVAGASAGVAEVLSSHHGLAPAASVINRASSPAPAPASTVPPGPGVTKPPSWPRERVANGMWGAELINRDTFNQDSLTSGSGSLYAASEGYLDRINPATGEVVASVPYTVSSVNPPVVTGNTVWVVSSYAGRGVVLHGYDGKTLARVASVDVPVAGQVSSTASGVLTAGSNGYLYVAAGSSVAVVNPGTRQVTSRISVPAGPVSSVAVSPDGSKLYASTGTFKLLTYNPVTGEKLSFSTMPGLTSTASNLVATSGGVWGTTGVGMTESAWFAPDADLARLARLSTGAGAGLNSIPAYSGGTVWIGGSHTLTCASPVTGQVLSRVTIPANGGVLESVGSVTVTGGRTYAFYLNVRAQQAGVVTLTPPGACSG